VVACSAACAPSFAAPPHLIAAWPQHDAAVASGPASLELTFNRTLAADLTNVRVVRVDDGWEPHTSPRVEPDAAEHLNVALDAGLPPGTYQVHWHAVAARGGGMSDDEYSFVVTGESAGPVPHLSVTPSATNAGDVIEVDGQGFGSNLDTDLRIGDDNVKLGTARTDKHGDFSIDLRAPAGVVAGVQPVQAQDEQGHRASAAVRVRWGGWPPLMAWTTGQPGPSPGEVGFHLVLRNRSDYVLEGLRVDLPVPDGAEFVSADHGGQESGRVVTWSIAWLDRGTVGPLEVIFHTTRPLAVHATFQFRHRRPHDCSGDECQSAFVSQTVSDSTPVAPLVEKEGD
jgi:methionine-rich copper-binding protein CopC